MKETLFLPSLTVKTLVLMAFIFLQEKFPSKIKIILFLGLGEIQIVVRNGMQHYVKLKTFSFHFVFSSVHSSQRHTKLEKLYAS